MSEPTSRLSVYDLVKEVALAAEIASYGTTGNEAAMVPVDAHDLDRCLRVVNTAIRGFIAKAPPNGWHWRNRLMEVALVRGYTGTVTAVGTPPPTTITDAGIAGDYDNDFFNGYVLRITAGTGAGEYATVTDYNGTTGTFTLGSASTADTTSEYRVCRSTQVIDSDPARYLLSEDFQGEVTGDISFVAGSNACGIEWTSEADIRRRREVSVNTGDAPFIAAILPYSTQRRWELIVDPQPTDEHTVVFPYRANFATLALLAGTASAGNATSLTDSDLAGQYPDNHFNDQTIRIISGTGKTSYAVVTDYTGATGVFTVADWLYQSGAAGGTDPVSGSVYYVDAGSVHPCGMQFDDAIMSACLAQTEQEFTDVKRGFVDKYLNVDLPAAWAIDGRTQPRKLGMMHSGGGGQQVRVIQRDIVEYQT